MVVGGYLMAFLKLRKEQLFLCCAFLLFVFYFTDFGSLLSLSSIYFLRSMYLAHAITNNPKVSMASHTESLHSPYARSTLRPALVTLLQCVVPGLRSILSYDFSSSGLQVYPARPMSSPGWASENSVGLEVAVMATVTARTFRKETLVGTDGLCRVSSVG